MGKQIMTVDDSATVRQMLQLSLEGAGYNMVAAADGEEALKKLENLAVVRMICPA